ncbi:MAG: helix-turn-helix domain-containing protein [Nanoarchaeota archaeon]
MSIVHEIPAKIVQHIEDGESIHSLAVKIGFAYSAVYKWVHELEKYGIVNVTTRGNKNSIRINKSTVYAKYKELDEAISSVEKDSVFWEIIKTTKLRVRFVRGTAIAIWTRGGFITGDFYDKIYFLEVDVQDSDSLKEVFREHRIQYTENDIQEVRPLVYIIPKRNIKKKIQHDLPVMPLPELVRWCKKLYLENVLEELSLLYNLKLKERYSEVATNV